MGVRIALMAALVLLALVLKVEVLPAFAVAGWRPDLLAAVVAAIALLEGPDTGLRLGFAAGLAQDLVSGTDELVGMWALVLLLGGYLAGVARPYITATPLVGGVVVTAAVAGGGHLAYGLLNRLFGANVLPAPEVLRGVLIVTVYTALLAPLVLRPVQALMRQHPPRTAG